MEIKKLIEKLEEKRIKYGDNIQVVVDVHLGKMNDKPVYYVISDKLNSSPTEETVIVLCCW